MQETNRIEFKQYITSEIDIEKEVVAFLNYREGGSIYIGIDKNGNVLGLDHLDVNMLQIKDRIKNNIQPSAMGLFDVQEETIEAKKIIRIIVASGSEKPYFKKKYGMTAKGCYIRVGTAAEPMPQAMIDSLFSKRTRNSIGKIKSNRQDLSFEQLLIYYQEKGTPLNNNFKRTLELLTEEGQYNYVAYLLADENNNSVKVAKYATLDRTELIENKDYGRCSLIKTAKAVQEKIINIENRTFTQITSKERKEHKLWDETALHEAIINAIVHNDYTFEVAPKFELFPDRIEITSAGTLSENMSKKEFFEGVSVPRNKELMRIFTDLSLVESLGSGVPRILKAYGEQSFQFMENFTRITFPVSPGGGQKGGQKGGTISNKTLTDRQLEIIQSIQNNPRIKRTEISVQLNINESAVQKHIKSLKEKGIITRIGGARGYWQVTLTQSKEDKE